MSGGTANLGFNCVSWRLREQILAAATSEQLRGLLRTLTLPEASDEDRAVVARLDAGEFPEILHHAFLHHGLRVDRERFITRAVELWEGDRELVTAKLEELAFVAGTRMWGEVDFPNPWLVLCCFHSDFARAELAGLEDYSDAVPPPFVAFDSADIVARAMGGLDAALRPLDQAYDPATAAAIADELERFVPTGFSVQPRVHFALELMRWDPVEQGTVDEFVARCIADMRDVYRRAKAGGFGVCVYWHPNP